MTTQNTPPCIWTIISLYTPNFTGAGIAAHKILKGLTGQGFSATVLTPGDFAAHHLRGRTVDEDGITIRYLSTLPRRQWNYQAPLPQKIIFYMLNLLHEFSMAILCAWIFVKAGRRHDIVQFQITNEFSFIPALAALARGMHPVIHLNLLGSDDPGSVLDRVKKGRFLEVGRLLTFYQAEAVVSIATALTRSCLRAKVRAKKIFQIPHGIDTHKFRPVTGEEKNELKKKLGLDKQKRYIVFTGSAIARKGIDVLIEAFLQIYQSIVDVELLIVGPCDFDDPTYKLALQLKKSAEKAECVSRIRWIGSVDNVHNYMQAADIFCLPTRREGFGVVIIEAMAVGLPVVVARLEGITTDIVQSSREGILINGHNPDDYARALRQLLDAPETIKTMGLNARERALSEFNLVHTTTRCKELYGDLASIYR